KGIDLSRCPMPFVRADHIERMVWETLESFLISPKIITEHLKDADGQVAHLEKELKNIDQGLAEIARRKSNLIDLYQYGRFKLSDLDQKMEDVEASEASLERRRTECLATIEAYRRRRLDPDKLYQVLAQIEEIFRFSRQEHRREIVRTLCRNITVRKGGELECSVALPQEPEIARLSASAAAGGEVVYPASLQWDCVPCTMNCQISGDD